MPYTAKEKKLMASLIKKYGAKKAIEVYHAMLNSGKYGHIFGSESQKK